MAFGYNQKVYQQEYFWENLNDFRLFPVYKAVLDSTVFLYKPMC